MRGLILSLLLCLAPLQAGAADLGAVLAKGLDGRPVPAAGVLVIRDYKVAGVAVRGVRRLGEPATVQPGDLWHLGSDGKAMTATMIARLVDRGVLRWDRTLEQMDPGLAAQVDPAFRTATLPDILSHRAGIGDVSDTDDIFPSFYDDNRPLVAQRRDWLVHVMSKPPVTPPRGKSQYSNTNFILAAYLAERATGKTYEQLMQREVFGPLGMRSASTTFAGPLELSGHVRNAPSKPRDANPAVLNPAGGWRMSLADWSRFCIDQMQGHEGRGRLLKPASYRMLQTAQGETKAALGWGSAPSAVGRQGPVLMHSGSDGNWFALVVLFPTRGTGALVTANAAEDMQGDKATSAMIRAAVEDLAPEAPK